MKSHIPMSSKTKKEIHALADERSRTVTRNYFNSVVAIYGLCWLMGLNEELGLGNKRLKDVVSAVNDVYEEFDIDFSTVDMDTALSRLTRAADSRNIDWKEIMGVQELVKEIDIYE